MTFRDGDVLAATVGQGPSTPARNASITSNMVDYRKHPLRDKKH